MITFFMFSCSDTDHVCEIQSNGFIDGMDGQVMMGSQSAVEVFKDMDKAWAALDYDKLKQALGIDFDFKRTHEKFIDKNLSLKAYDIKNSIVEAVKQNKNITIQNLDVLTEAGVLFELEKHFYDIPFFNLNFNFQSTKDIYNYITEYPNYMRRPNNLFLQNWRIYNVK